MTPRTTRLPDWGAISGGRLAAYPPAVPAGVSVARTRPRTTWPIGQGNLAQAAMVSRTQAVEMDVDPVGKNAGARQGGDENIGHSKLPTDFFPSRAFALPHRRH